MSNMILDEATSADGSLRVIVYKERSAGVKRFTVQAFVAGDRDRVNIFGSLLDAAAYANGFLAGAYTIDGQWPR